MTTRALLAAFVLAAAPALAGGLAARPGAVEGRPSDAALSPVQRLIDAASPGARVEVPPGTYTGDLVVDKPLHLVGAGRVVLRGSGSGSVVRVRADRVTIDGFEIDGRRGGDLGRDSSGIHVAARDAVIRNCTIHDALFGVYLREADRSAVEYCTIRGIPGRDPGEKGSGIHAYLTQQFRFVGNELVDVRDALYLQNSSRGVVRSNRARDMRYGLHYMYSDDNVFEDNTFENGAAGTAVMYSKRVVFRRNRFVRNRGFASVGLLLQQCDDVLAEDNLIADNARGVFLEGTRRIVLRRNAIAQSDAAVVLYDSTRETRFAGNVFAGNLTSLLLVGRRTDARFEGNYWSDNPEPDLDGDGVTDRPYRLANIFDHLRGNLTAADLFTDSLGAVALASAERALPIIETPSVVDARPLARPPALHDLPSVPAPTAASHVGAMGAALVAAMGGLVVLGRGRRPLQASRRGRP